VYRSGLWTRRMRGDRQDTGGLWRVLSENVQIVQYVYFVQFVRFR
jgi:hypothetical protein